MATRLGVPPVQRPRALDLRAMQEVVDAVRQRLAAADAEITRLASVADASTAAGQIAQLQQNLLTLQQRITAVEAAVGTADAVVLTAAAPVAEGDAVVPAGTTSCRPADPSDPLEVFGVIGLARNVAAPGQSVTVQRRGTFSVPGAAFDVGRAVYVGLGGLTQAPTYGDFVVPVGVATGATSLWVAVSAPILQRPGLYGAPADDFLPLSFGLARELIPRITVSPTAPPDPQIDDLWVDTS